MLRYCWTVLFPVITFSLSLLFHPTPYLHLYFLPLSLIPLLTDANILDSCFPLNFPDHSCFILMLLSTRTFSLSLSFLSTQTLRYWTMMGTPFLVFYVVGLVLQLNLLYVLKIGIFTGLYIIIYGVSRVLFDERLMTVMPMAVYLATKVLRELYAPV